MTENLEQKRAELIEISEKAVEFAKADDNIDVEATTINSLILEFIYDTELQREFKTYKMWQKEGFQVKKGAKAFLLWGRPLKGKKKKEIEQNAEKQTDKEKTYKFFPLAYVFSDEQVTKIEN